MFEIITTLAEPTIRVLCAGEFAGFTNHPRATEIRSEAFLLYQSLNEVLVAGSYFVERLKYDLSWLHRKMNAGEPERKLITDFEFILQQVSISMLKARAAISRLGLDYEVIPVADYAPTIPLMHGKLNLISILVRRIRGQTFNPVTNQYEGPKLVSVELSNLARLRAAWAERLEHANARSRGEFDPDGTELELLALSASGFLSSHLPFACPVSPDSCFVTEDIDTLSIIPARCGRLIEAYLQVHDPAPALQELERMLTALSGTIERKVSISDVVLSVGDERLSVPEWGSSRFW